MKNILRVLPLFLLAIAFTSCLEEKCNSTITYVRYDPVYLYPEDYRVDIIAEGPQDLCEPGGFYVYEDYLLVIEKNKGLHILDNADASNPAAVSFLPVKGAVGLAVRNDVLYINNYTDLVAFGLTDPASPTMLSRTEDVFEQYGAFVTDPNFQGAIIVDYIETDEELILDCDDQDANILPVCFFADCWWGFRGANNDRIFASTTESAGAFADQSSGGSGEQVGIGGSLARFTIAAGTLYAVEETNLKAFSLADPSNPAFSGTVNLQWGVETIFPYGDELYIGTNSGMHIMNIDDPLNPVRLSSMEHVRACDPVVVSNDKAYVTLRGGGPCGGFSNQLEIVDVANPSQPVRLATYPMSGPVGLTVADGKLFICEPDYQFNVYDLDDEGMLGDLLSRHAELSYARDVIGLPWLDQLITIGSEGVDQLRYDEAGNLTNLSRLEICTDL
ncbi:MAG: hypothetical protein AAFU67_00725 [Bacteroidota bacterium]